MAPIVLFCFSHLRWNFVYQRPQHLMSRLQRRAQVFFFEEPLWEPEVRPRLSISRDESGVQILTPVLPTGTGAAIAVSLQRSLLKKFVEEQKIERTIAWYYTPMALAFTDELRPELAVYDCMDELSAFQGAPAEMIELERRLFNQVDVVFAGGRSLYEVKRKQHGNVHLFPSSIDRQHFAAARNVTTPPSDQRDIPHPRIGFFGVLDERLDRDLLAAVAADRPDWSLVLIGPVVKIAADALPRLHNIYYLGQKRYAQLPEYLAGWDVAMLPFARNSSTRFISPTKTPEYLAAGKRVVSTPIHDVVEPYGRLGLVEIAAGPRDFSSAIEKCLGAPDQGWWHKVEKLLSRTSWDITFGGMWDEITRLGGEPRTGQSQPAGRSSKEVASV